MRSHVIFGPMKRITAIGLIFLMSLPGIYNLGVITYFQMNRQYIAQVLCINREKPMSVCNGQCFLQQNLDIDDPDTDDQSTAPGKERLEFSVFVVTESAHLFNGISEFGCGNCAYLSVSSSPHLIPPFHPPSIS